MKPKIEVYSSAFQHGYGDFPQWSRFDIETISPQCEITIKNLPGLSWNDSAPTERLGQNVLVTNRTKSLELFDFAFTA